MKQKKQWKYTAKNGLVAIINRKVGRYSPKRVKHDDPDVVTSLIKLPIRLWDRDPFTYEGHISLTPRSDFSKRLSRYSYKVQLRVYSSEFTKSNYLSLKGKSLLASLIDGEAWDSDGVIDFEIESFEWSYKPHDNQYSSSSSIFKKRVSSAINNYFRTRNSLIDDIGEVMEKIVDEEITKPLNKVMDEKKPLRERLNLFKTYDAYPKEKMFEIKDYLFGNTCQFYNGDDIRRENGVLLIPNYWVQRGILQGVKRPMGFGKRVSIIEFDESPVNWALVRLNTVWNDPEDVLIQHLAREQGKRVGAQVGIVEKFGILLYDCDGVTKFKQVEESMFSLPADRLEIAVSLLIGAGEDDKALAKTDPKF